MVVAQRGFRVRALGEVAIRCRNLPKMVAFYRDIIGLEPLSGDYSKHIQFFRIAAGFGGHTSVLALFHADEQPGGSLTTAQHQFSAGQGSSLHHLALSLPFEEQAAAIDWFDRHAVAYRIEDFAWVGWRGVFTSDPEGNTVELVAYDPGSGVPPAASDAAT